MRRVSRLMALLLVGGTLGACARPPAPADTLQSLHSAHRVLSDTACMRSGHPERQSSRYV
jgi:hypothetical protein